MHHESAGERIEAEQQRDADERLLCRREARGGVIGCLDHEWLIQAGGNAVDGGIGWILAEVDVEVADGRRNLERGVQAGAAHDEHVAAVERPEAGIGKQPADGHCPHSLPTSREEQLVADPEAISVGPGLRRQDAIGVGGGQRVAGNHVRPPDGGVCVDVDAEHEQGEDALVVTRGGRNREPALGNRRDGADDGEVGLQGPAVRPARIDPDGQIVDEMRDPTAAKVLDRMKSLEA